MLKHLLLLLLITINGTAYADPSLLLTPEEAAEAARRNAGPGYGPGMMWRIEKDGRTAHIVGSLHLAPASLYPLPAPINDAFDDAGLIVFEVDPRTLDAAFQERLGKAGTRPDDAPTLREQLDRDTRRRLEDAITSLHMPRNALDRSEPWMAALILTLSRTMRMQHPSFTINDGIDRHFTALARQQRKEIAGLETVDDQLRLFTSLDSETSVGFLRQTLEELDILEQLAARLVDTWKRGDSEAIAGLIDDSFRDYPDVRRAWLTDRNRNWARRIDTFLQDSRNPFIVVGAAHLAGPDSLPALLEAQGYLVQQITENQTGAPP